MLILADIAIAVYVLVDFKDRVNEGVCDPLEWNGSDELYKVYNEYRIVMGTFITVVLIVSTCLTARMLRSHFGRFFDNKVKDMVLVMIVFVVSYSIWSAYAYFEWLHTYN